VVELANERAIGTSITASASLSSAQRNRFTQVTSAGTVTLTVVVYAGIVTGSEHEFVNMGGVVTFAADTGVTIRSANSKLTVTLYGAAVLKYVGSSTFCLIGALE